MVKSSPKSAQSNDQPLTKLRPSILGKGFECWGILVMGKNNIQIYQSCQSAFSFCDTVFDPSQQAQVPTAVVLDFDKLDCPPGKGEVI